MKIQKIVSIFFCVILIAFRCSSQSFTKADIDSVQWRIYDFLQSHQKESYDSVASEVILVLLETNGKSKITSIHLLADEKNKGVAYGMLSKMTLADLKGWNPENFANRTIIVPVYSSWIHVKSNYADKSFWDMSWSGNSGYIVNNDQKHSVLLSGVMYNPPPPRKGNETMIR